MKRILIAGGSGFIGRNLVHHLKKEGYSVILLSRTPRLINGYDQVITWDEIIPEQIATFDVVINLCGYGISEKRWSPQIKNKIVNSRVETTEYLIKLIGDNDIWLINASAIGFYPFSFKLQNEDNIEVLSKHNTGFCQYIAKQWEAVVIGSRLRRKTILRFGIVLGKGGMLNQLLSSVKMGMGARIGDGQQLMSWVHINDLCRALLFLLTIDAVNTTFNIVAPNACTQAKFMRILCQKMNKRQWFVIPKFMVKLMFGQMGNELLLASHCIEPKRLQNLEFKFIYPTIELALESIVKETQT